MTHIYVATTNDQRTNQTDTVGAFTGLADARRCTQETVQVLNDGAIRGFVEQWDGGGFIAHHELRWQTQTTHPDGTVTPAGWVWWRAEEPSFTPFKDPNQEGII